MMIIRLRLRVVCWVFVLSSAPALPATLPLPPQAKIPATLYHLMKGVSLTVKSTRLIQLEKAAQVAAAAAAAAAVANSPDAAKLKEEAEKAAKEAADQAANDLQVTVDAMSDFLNSSVGMIVGGAATGGATVLGAPVWIGVAAGIAGGMITDAYFSHRASDGMEVRIKVPSGSPNLMDPPVALDYGKASKKPVYPSSGSPVAYTPPPPKSPETEPSNHKKERSDARITYSLARNSKDSTIRYVSYNQYDGWDLIKKSSWDRYRYERRGGEDVLVETIPESDEQGDGFLYDRFSVSPAQLNDGMFKPVSTFHGNLKDYEYIAGLPDSAYVMPFLYPDRVDPVSKEPKGSWYIAPCESVEACAQYAAGVESAWMEKLIAHHNAYNDERFRYLEGWFVQLKKEERVEKLVKNFPASPYRTWDVYRWLNPFVKLVDSTQRTYEQFFDHKSGAIVYENKWGKGAKPVLSPASALPLRDEDRSPPLSPELMAALANGIWQGAAANPAYPGIPFTQGRAFTPTDMAKFAAAHPDIYPQLPDILTQALGPNGGLIKVADQTTIINNTTNNHTENKVDLGEDPGIPPPTLEETTASSILSPLLGLFPELRSYSVPAHGAVCPQGSVDLWGKTFYLNYQCVLLEKHRQAIFAVFQLCWVLSSLFIFLRA